MCPSALPALSVRFALIARLASLDLSVLCVSPVGYDRLIGLSCLLVCPDRFDRLLCSVSLSCLTCCLVSLVGLALGLVMKCMSVVLFSVSF